MGSIAHLSDYVFTGECQIYHDPGGQYVNKTEYTLHNVNLLCAHACS